MTIFEAVVIGFLLLVILAVVAGFIVWVCEMVCLVWTMYRLIRRRSR